MDNILRHQFGSVTAKALEPETFDSRDIGALRNIFKTKAMHRGWTPIHVTINGGINQTIFDVPPKDSTVNPRGVFVLTTGYESSPLLFSREIKKITTAGFHVIGVPLLNVRQSDNLIEDNKTLIERLMFAENSPLNRAELDGLDYFSITHSAGGLNNLWAALQSDNAQLMAKYKHVFHTGTYVAPASASKIYDGQPASNFETLSSLFISQAYRYYATRIVPNIELGSSRIDKVFLKLKGKTLGAAFVDNSTYRAPTHQDAIDLSDVGEDVVTLLTSLKQSDPNHPIFNIPQTFIMGHKDPASCIRTTRYVAKDLLGAHFKHSYSGHVSLKEDLAVITNILSHALATTSEPRARDIAIERPAVAKSVSPPASKWRFWKRSTGTPAEPAAAMA